MIDTKTLSTQEQAFYRLRRSIGLVGLCFPFVLVIGGFAFSNLEQAVLPTLSHYFFTPMRDVFSGLLVAIGIFLISYKGYSSPGGIGSDAFLSTTAGILSIMVAFFPFQDCSDAACTLPQAFLSESIVQWIHYGAAIGFLYILSIMARRNFTQTGNQPVDPDKERRNRIYRNSGKTIQIALAVLILVAAIGFFVPRFEAFADKTAIILVLESICIIAFAISWLVKGRADQMGYGVMVKMILR